MAANEQSAFAFERTASNIIKDFCDVPDFTIRLISENITLEQRLNLDPVSRLAIAELATVSQELNKEFKNAEKSTLKTPWLQLLQQNNETGQETAERLAQQFLAQQVSKRLGQKRQNGEKTEGSEKFVRTAVKSAAEVLELVTEPVVVDGILPADHQSSLTKSKLPPPLVLDLSDDENGQSVSARFSQKSSACSSRSSRRSVPSVTVASSASSLTQTSAHSSSSSVTNSTGASYDTQHDQLIDHATHNLDVVARQVTTHLMQNEEFLEQLKGLQSGDHLQSPQLLLADGSPLKQQIQQMAQSALFLHEPAIASRPLSVSAEDTMFAQDVKFTREWDNEINAQNQPDISTTRIYATPLKSVCIQTEEKLSQIVPHSIPAETQTTSNIQPEIFHIPEGEDDNEEENEEGRNEQDENESKNGKLGQTSSPTKRSTTTIGDKCQQEQQGQQQQSFDLMAESQETSTTMSTSHSWSVGEIPLRTLAKAAPNLNVIMVEADGNVMTNGVKTREHGEKPKVSEWLRDHPPPTVGLFNLSLSISSSNNSKSFADYESLEIVSALKRRSESDDDISTMDQITENLSQE